LAAEDITSRFLNVVGLFNGFIPLIALQMTAVKFGDQISLMFTKVMDAMMLGMPEEEEEGQAVTDRNYWESIRGTKATVAMADEVLKLTTGFAPDLEPTYNKFYIGLAQAGRPNNFIILRHQKSSIRAEIWLPSSPEIDQELEHAGIAVMDYDKRWKRYRLRLAKDDIKRHAQLLTKLLALAYGVKPDVGVAVKTQVT
jgi:hypothetical protein